MFALSACGGGGGGNTGAVSNPQSPSSTLTLKVSLTGTLPVNTTIAGVDFTLFLPENYSPAMTNGVVDSGVVTPTGIFTGTTLAPQIDYTAASTLSPALLKVTLASSIPAGISVMGDIATINLRLINGATANSITYGLSSVSVIDSVHYSQISGVNAELTAN